MSLAISAKLLIAEWAGSFTLFQHIKLPAGVLHLLQQAFVVLFERIDACCHRVNIGTLLFDSGSLLVESSISLLQCRLPFPDFGQSVHARLQLGGYAVLQCFPRGRDALFLPRNGLRQRRAPRIKTALLRKRGVQPFKLRLRRLERLIAGEYLGRV